MSASNPVRWIFFFQILKDRRKNDPIFFPLYNELAQGPVFLFSFGGCKRIFPFPAVSDNLRVPVRRDVNCYCVKDSCIRGDLLIFNLLNQKLEPALVFLVSSRWRLLNSPNLHQPPVSRGFEKHHLGLAWLLRLWSGLTRAHTRPRKRKRP